MINFNALIRAKKIKTKATPVAHTLRRVITMFQKIILIFIQEPWDIFATVQKVVSKVFFGKSRTLTEA